MKMFERNPSMAVMFQGRGRQCYIFQGASPHHVSRPLAPVPFFLLVPGMATWNGSDGKVDKLFPWCIGDHWSSGHCQCLSIHTSGDQGDRRNSLEIR